MWRKPQRKSLDIPATAEGRLQVIAELLAKGLYRLRHPRPSTQSHGRIHRLASLATPSARSKKSRPKDLQSSSNGASMHMHGGKSRCSATNQ
jgi:hypothetical protein